MALSTSCVMALSTSCVMALSIQYKQCSEIQTIVIINISFYRKYRFISPFTYKKVSKTIQDCKGWRWKCSKCYLIKKQIEPFCIHPLELLLIIKLLHICVYSSNKQGFVTSFVHKYVSYMFRDDVRQSYL